MAINFVAKAAITAVMMAGQMALGAMRKIEGPRLDSRKVTIAEYGTPLDDFYGIRKLTGCPLIWADDLREEKKKSKTKGGKYTEYKYYGDWAIAVAGHEIDSVRRIWFDEHLVYQIGDVGPVSIGGFASDLLTQASDRVLKLGVGRNLRIYLGTETQQPDELIEAWFEDHDDFGANCVSAMRGTAYIVFQDIPLEKFGNRIPQVTVEAINGGTDSFLSEIMTDGYGTSDAYFSTDHHRLVMQNSGVFQVWDLATRTLLFSGANSHAGNAIAVNSDGSFYARGSGDIVHVSEGGGSAIVVENPGIECGGNIFKAGGALWADGAIGSEQAALISTATNEVVTYDIGFRATYYFTDEDDNAWAAGEMPTADGFGLAKILPFDGTNYEITTGSAGAAYAMDNGAGQFFVWQNDQLYLIGKDDGATDLGPVAAPSFVASDESTIFRGVQPGFDRVWIGLSEVSTRTLSTLRSYDPTDWDGISSQVRDPIYSSALHAIISDPLLGDPNIRYLDRVDSSGVTLETIVETESAAVNCTIDAGDLNQLVPGVSFGPGPVNARIAPLLDLHDSIIRPHDMGLQGIKRGTTSVDTIETSEFVRDGSSARYEVEIMQDNDLPQRLEVKYSALNNDQEINNVLAFRHTQAVDTSRVQQIDMATYADTPDAMQQKADRFLRRIWNSKATVKNTLTAQYLAAEVGDLYDLDLDGVTWTCELEKITLAATTPSISCEWRRTFPSLNTLGDGTAPDMDGRPDDVIFVPSQTKGFVLDVPLIADADNDINPALYVAAGKYTPTWSGAVVWEGSDGTYDDAVTAIDSSHGATWGYTTETLADANPNLWDRGNSFEVTVFGGTLSSSTEAAINADASINQCAVGINGRWEILNFTTATLTGTSGVSRTYTISGLLRGRRGTEMNTGNHDGGDLFLMLDQAETIGLGTDSIGDDLSYKVQTLGRDPDAAVAIDIDPYTAASLKPYAPIIWHVQKDDSTGDITIEIRTRTRHGAAWNGSTIPTGETIAEYEFDVVDGSGTVLRTLESTDKTFTYTAAQQTTDHGSEITAAALEGYAYQLSATVGRGFARAA